MKKLHYIVLITIAFLVSNCDTNDDGFYNNVYADVPNLVRIDPHSSTYAVGEKLYVSTLNFNSILTETGGKTLDVIETTGATQFEFSYLIEKQSGDTWQTVSVNDSQLDIVSGQAQNGSYVYGIAQYNEVNDEYEYRVGFPLLSPGTYRLSFGYNSQSTDSVELRSLSPAKRLVLNVNSIVDDVDNGGYYNFTVN